MGIFDRAKEDPEQGSERAVHRIDQELDSLDDQTAERLAEEDKETLDAGGSVEEESGDVQEPPD
ncbi:MAG TPA: hypothetical protein VFP89_01535 [Propionibacteriaceae bacterium]|nr:hypothetical protein [Propionibacteriaceae bacterium]